MENTENINWISLITDLLEILVITKNKLAWKCDVTETAVSNWTTGKRTPQGFGKLVLLQLAEDHGLDLKNYKVSEFSSRKAAGNQDLSVSISSELLKFIREISSLSKEQQKEIIEMADFMIDSFNATK